MTSPTLKARPIFETFKALFWAVLSGSLIFSGLSGLPLYVPPIGVAMVGTAFFFTAFFAFALAWQHWRLAAAQRDLERAIQESKP